MKMPRWMIATAVIAVSLAARDPVIEAYDAYRLREGWDTCDVIGSVIAVGPREGRVTIGMGSDEGIARGEVLYLFRGGSETRYIGKARVISLDPDSAEGQVVARSRGIAIREGDRVAHLTWRELLPGLCGTGSGPLTAIGIGATAALIGSMMANAENSAVASVRSSSSASESPSAEILRICSSLIV